MTVTVDPDLLLSPPPGTPRLLSRIKAAEALNAVGYKIKPQSLTKWPVKVFMVGRLAHHKRDEIFDEANRRIAESMRPQTYRRYG
jgi:hypothetical protein